ncbi:MAG TPA: hypothetical protein VFC29_03005 [Candidatus Limnocylindrales bacterium]|nr:hypothetical protein [Candidatus Limnocylindrales bacterium]
MAVFVLLTAAATITTREHYFIDLFAAVPFIYVTIERARWMSATPEDVLNPGIIAPG